MTDNHRFGSGRVWPAIFSVSLISILAGLCAWQVGGCSQAVEQPDHRSGGQQATDVTIFFTSDTRGRIEDCGCPSKPKGGLPRRATALQAYGTDPYLLLDAGNMNTPSQSFILLNWKYELDMMGRMKYQAANIGRTEVQVSKKQLLEVAGSAPVPLISANVVDAQSLAPILPAYVILEQFGKSIGVLGLLDEGYEDVQIHHSLTVTPAGEALGKILTELKGKCDMLILLADMPLDRAKTLAKDYPQIALVIVAQQPQQQSESVSIDKTYLVEAGRGDYRLAKLTAKLTHDKLGDLNVQEFKLGDETAEDMALVQMIEEYNNKLNQRISGLQGGSQIQRWWDLYHNKGIKSWYGGAVRCAACHRQDYKSWSRSAHAHAYSTLVEKNRHTNPECLRCHTVGFNEPSGFKLEEFSEHLRGVQCESCHGEASNHDIMNRGVRPAQKPTLREYPDTDAIVKLCMTCHDPANSPDFDYLQYWKKIDHGRKAEVPEAFKSKLKANRSTTKATTQSKPAGKKGS